MFLFLKLFGFTTVFLLSLFIYRPFCKYFCPFGVFLGFFNKLSPLRYQIDASCNKCGLCKRKCKMGLVPFESPNNMECIRCGQCLHTCPRKALKKKQDVL
ncbi:MAG: 4Fe-4S binding protein [Blautia hansenii]|nr:4Fe-4S binding protein [Blautia hansenii]MBS5091264.1 4Fe-4S binding protein [Lachnospiraceae bacterium]MEE0656675.1 4Fe-4S binding protein [Blautia hansenii]